MRGLCKMGGFFSSSSSSSQGVFSGGGGSWGGLRSGILVCGLFLVMIHGDFCWYRWFDFVFLFGNRIYNTKFTFSPYLMNRYHDPMLTPRTLGDESICSSSTILLPRA